MNEREKIIDNIRFITRLIDECRDYGDKNAEDLLWRRFEELDGELSDIKEEGK